MEETAPLAALEEETRVLRALAQGLARREGSAIRAQVRHYEQASQLLARLRRSNPRLAQRFIRLASEDQLLREELGSGSVARLHESTEAVMRARQTTHRLRHPGAHPSRGYLWLVSHAILDLRDEPRIQAIFAGREDRVERWITFYQQELLPYLRALLAAHLRGRITWQEWFEPIRLLG